MPNTLADTEEQIHTLEARRSRILKKIEDNEADYKHIKSASLKKSADEENPYVAKTIMTKAISVLNSLNKHKAELMEQLSSVNEQIDMLKGRRNKLAATYH